MSYVYSVTIQLGDFDKESDAAVEKLNKWLGDHNHLGIKFSYVNGQEAAGTKVPEVGLIWGGFNYLAVEEFISFFKELKLDRSLLTIIHPESEVCTVIPSNIKIRQETDQ